MRLQNNSIARGGFVIGEIILSITTVSVMMGVALTSLTVYLYVMDRSEAIATPNGAAGVLPAADLSMDALLFHFALQEHVHEADLVYVIGGAGADPSDSGPADFIFDPPVGDDDLEELKLLEDLEDFPHRAMSSAVITSMLKKSDDFKDNFDPIPVGEETYTATAFCILTVIHEKDDYKVTSMTTHDAFLTTDGQWVVLESNLYEPAGKSWSSVQNYRCAVEEADFDRLGNQLRLGANHHWARHDDANVSDGAASTLWDRCEEAVCRVSFPDPTWNIKKISTTNAVRSKFTYFLPTAK